MPRPKRIDPLLEDLNSGEPRSALALSDLRWCIEYRQPTSEIASFLCRSPQEVKDKAKELGFKLPKAIGQQRKGHQNVRLVCLLAGALLISVAGSPLLAEKGDDPAVASEPATENKKLLHVAQ